MRNTTAAEELQLPNGQVQQPSSLSGGQYHGSSKRVKTIREPWAVFVNTIEALISGPNLLTHAESAVSGVANHILDELTRRASDALVHTAVRFGSPYLIPLSGEQAGARIELPMSAFTYVLHEGIVEAEPAWMLPDADAGWVLPRRISALEAN